MVITRTPFRISFFGGGTDFPAFYLEHGGSVLSSSINKYCYITTRFLPPFFNYNYRIRYTSREEAVKIDDIRHPVVREVLRKFGLAHGIEMVHASDIPAMSGIGSSSAFTVGFLQGMYALSGKMTTKRQLAREAIEIEQNVLKENVGSQDQIATSFGGFNRIDFNRDGSFHVTPITIPKERIKELKERLLFVFTGFSRYSSEIAAEQVKSIPDKKATLLQMKALVDDSIAILDGSGPIGDFGRLLHESWMLKRSLSNAVSNSMIDECYAEARKAGATGGKILGAGGGGFLLLFVPPERRQDVKKALRKMLFVPFEFEGLGSQIVMYSTVDGGYEAPEND